MEKLSCSVRVQRTRQGEDGIAATEDLVVRSCEAMPAGISKFKLFNKTG